MKGRILKYSLIIFGLMIVSCQRHEPPKETHAKALAPSVEDKSTPTKKTDAHDPDLRRDLLELKSNEDNPKIISSLDLLKSPSKPKGKTEKDLISEITQETLSGRKNSQSTSTEKKANLSPSRDNIHPYDNEEPNSAILTKSEVEAIESSAGFSDETTSADSLIGGIHNTVKTAQRGQHQEATFDFTGNAEEPLSEIEKKEFPPVLYGGQARGYAMLYLMHPKARKTVEAQLSALLQSGVKAVHLAVLVDGTFSKDYDYLASVLKRFASAGRIISLALYLSNGSTQRIYSKTPIEAGFNLIEPGRFRTLIRYDPETREKFRSIVREANAAFVLNSSLGKNNRNIAIVMLEDNLRFLSYKAMREIAQSEFTAPVNFIRNPCPSCYSGNDMDSGGDPIELHGADQLSLLARGDGLTLDGEGIYFPWEASSQGISVETAKLAAQEALKKGLSYFALWRAQRQGLGGKESVLVHPDNRSFEVPSERALELEIEILRAGLEYIGN